MWPCVGGWLEGTRMSPRRYRWIPAVLRPPLKRLRDRFRTMAAQPASIGALPSGLLARRVAFGHRNAVDDSNFHCRIDAIPDEIEVGRGTTLFLSGICFHAARRVKRLSVLVNGKSHPVSAYGMPRKDVMEEFTAAGVPPELPFYSGFW